MKIIPFIFLVFIIKGGISQSYNQMFNDRIEFTESDSSKIYLHIKNYNYFRNNEYFNKHQVGYTLVGYTITPTFEYQFGARLKVSGGIHLLKYSGIDKFSLYSPVYTATLKFKNGYLVLGSLYGSLNHGLVEPLYSFENLFTNNPENGLQILFNKPWFKLDTWIDWRKFIFQKDPQQERFTFGLSTTVKMGKKDENLIFEIPFQTLITHRGGQIDTSDNNLQSLANAAAGIKIGYSLKTRFLQNVTLSGFHVVYKDISPNPELVFEKGHGDLFSVLFSGKFWYCDFTYWKGYKYFSPIGDPLYLCTSQNDTAYHTNQRELGFIKLIFQKEIYRGITWSVRGELYQNIDGSGPLDYSYGTKITVDTRFFIRSLQAEK